MGDIRSPGLLYAKGLLLLGCGILASALLLAAHPSVKTAALLAVAVWSFARAYYFAFYVIEHYIDPGHRYAGLVPFVRYLLRRQPRRDATIAEGRPPDEPWR
jgi:hypothetical protein